MSAVCQLHESSRSLGHLWLAQSPDLLNMRLIIDWQPVVCLRFCRQLVAIFCLAQSWKSALLAPLSSLLPCGLLLTPHLRGLRCSAGLRLVVYVFRVTALLSANTMSL